MGAPGRRAPGSGGTVDVAGSDPGAAPADGARALVGLVPQTPSDLLYLATVGGECAQADRDAGVPRRDVPRPAGAARRRRSTADQHPRDLSEGQRLALVLAVQLTRRRRSCCSTSRPVASTTAPRTGSSACCATWPATGRAVVVSTHDVEFVAAVADRVVVLADGEVVADGPTADVVVASPAFAPQVAKVLPPQPWLTPAQVADALGRERSDR